MAQFNPQNIKDVMFTADYWLDKLAYPDRLILTESAINSFNSKIIEKQPQLMKDFNNYPPIITKNKLASLIVSKSSMFEQNYYHNQYQLSTECIQEITNNLNLNNIPSIIIPKYGLTLVRTNIRTFPTDYSVYNDLAELNFDLWQETAVNPLEPVIVLQTSCDFQWYFIQTYNYCGWVKKSNLLLISCYSDWMKYVNNSNFLIVIGDKLSIIPKNKSIELIFEMGAKLYPVYKNKQPLFRTLIKLPIKKENQTVEQKLLLINFDNNINYGYLPYSQTNILQQAFKMLNQPYGWGGKDAKIDCSAFISNIFRTFGFKLPRNAEQQVCMAGLTIPLANLNLLERYQILSTFTPGTLLFLDGHVMLFLGEDKGRFYAIHALSNYGKMSNSGVDKVPLFRVTVTSLDLLRPNGKSLLESLTTAKVLTL